MGKVAPLETQVLIKSVKMNNCKIKMESIYSLVFYMLVDYIEVTVYMLYFNF